MHSYRYYDSIMALFVAVLLISNIASSAKIIDWGYSLFDLRLSFDAGTLLFPISYIFDDILTEVYGFKRSRKVIWIGFFSLCLLSLCLSIVQNMPGETEWLKYAGNDAYSAILGGVSSGGIVLASLSAYLMGEFSNSIIMAKMKTAMHGRILWMRTIGSTIVGEALDTVTFVIIACTFGVFPWGIALSLILTNYIFKVGIEVLFTPLTYQAVAFLKKAEQVDFDDSKTSFSPFAISFDEGENSDS